MAILKGTYYQSGNLDFTRSDNEWAFAQVTVKRDNPPKTIAMQPEKIPLEIARSADMDADSVPWLEPITKLLNACDKVQFQIRETAMRVRQAICNVDANHQLVVLVSQEAIAEFAQKRWRNMAYFYAHRSDSFRFNVGKVISRKAHEAKRANPVELQLRVVPVEDDIVPTLTFDATGSTADVALVDWRKNVAEGKTGLFKHDERDVNLTITQARQPIILLHEKRPEFKNYSHVFAGDKLNKLLNKVLKRADQRAATE